MTGEVLFTVWIDGQHQVPASRVTLLPPRLLTGSGTNGGVL